MSYYGVNPCTQTETIWFETPEEVADYIIDCDEDLQDWTCVNHYGKEVKFFCVFGQSYSKSMDNICINEANWPGEPCYEHKEEVE